MDWMGWREPEKTGVRHAPGYTSEAIHEGNHHFHSSAPVAELTAKASLQAVTNVFRHTYGNSLNERLHGAAARFYR